MLAEIHMQFLDSSMDRIEHVEVTCVTELENVAYAMLKREKADLANFSLLTDDSQQ